ncbi:MAG: ATP-binding cassette domain-containing protein [Lachnospiraceae bacterium]|nr:ATP-binding cassette domain-containing protein [Lachnospiraceae bacterium]
MDFLKINNLKFKYASYDESYIPEGNVLDDVSLNINEGEIITLCGPTGCGKSTLLKLLKKEIAPQGMQSGDIIFCGKNLSELSPLEQAKDIALLFQNPEDQIVTDKVWHEIAFGLENLGIKNAEMENRIAEIIAFFRLESISKSDTATLSGGQKQLLVLASLLAMSPKLLLLDEPISALDPENAESFISTLKRLHKQLGITIIIAEHKVSYVAPISDKMAVMDKGRIVCFDTPNNAMNVYERLLPPIVPVESKMPKPADSEPAVSIKNAYFRYSKKEKDVLENLSADFKKGTCYSIFGCNAAGKSTLLNLISGLLKVQEGKISWGVKKPKIAYIPQNVELMFLSDTVRGELINSGYSKDNIPDYTKDLNLSSSPFDLSGGEKQLLALAKISLLTPDILLLDEPSKGMDTNLERIMFRELNRFTENGTCTIMSTHDLHFARTVADMCSIMSMGKLTGFLDTEAFFKSNKLYSI